MDIEPFDSHLKPTEIRTISETTTRDTFPEVRITVRSPSRAFNTEIEAFQKALKEGNIETRINSLSKKIEESNRKIESDRHSAHEAKKSFFGTRGGLTKVKLFNGTTFLFAIGACGVEVFEKISGEKGNNAVKLAGGLALGATILVSLGVFGGSFLFNRNQRKLLKLSNAQESEKIQPKIELLSFKLLQLLAQKLCELKKSIKESPNSTHYYLNEIENIFVIRKRLNSTLRSYLSEGLLIHTILNWFPHTHPLVITHKNIFECHSKLEGNYIQPDQPETDLTKEQTAFIHSWSAFQAQCGGHLFDYFSNGEIEIDGYGRTRKSHSYETFKTSLERLKEARNARTSTPDMSEYFVPTS